MTSMLRLQFEYSFITNHFKIIGSNLDPNLLMSQGKSNNDEDVPK